MSVWCCMGAGGRKFQTMETCLSKSETLVKDQAYVDGHDTIKSHRNSIKYPQKISTTLEGEPIILRRGIWLRKTGFETSNRTPKSLIQLTHYTLSYPGRRQKFQATLDLSFHLQHHIRSETDKVLYIYKKPLLIISLYFTSHPFYLAISTKIRFALSLSLLILRSLVILLSILYLSL